MQASAPVRQQSGFGIGVLLFAIGFAIFSVVIDGLVTNTFHAIFAVLGFFAGMFIGWGLYVIVREARHSP